MSGSGTRHIWPFVDGIQRNLSTKSRRTERGDGKYLSGTAKPSTRFRNQASRASLSEQDVYRQRFAVRVSGTTVPVYMGGFHCGGREQDRSSSAWLGRHLPNERGVQPQDIQIK